MNKLTNLKALLLFAFFALFLLNPASLNAQKSDGFFRGGNDSYENRATIDDDGGMGHWGIGETVPVGSGLLILTAIGAGYAIARRKRSRRDTSNVSKYGTLLLAFALIIGMTNCKKKAETIQSVAENNGVKITLNIEGGNSKVNVDPTNGGLNNFASVNYEVGDIIYVGYNNNYVGYLTYVEDSKDGNHFTGSVNILSAVDEQPLHFYFLGGKDIQPDPSAVSNNELSVVISDQTSKYPVISYAHSKQPYSTENTKYTAKLLSKCSIMKLNVTSRSTRTICITGMNNKVTVDFSKVNESGDGLIGDTDQGFSYSADEKYGGLISGLIKIKGSDSQVWESWIIVLPQEALTEGGDGSAYTNEEPQRYKGKRPALDAISSNQYLSDGIALNVDTEDNDEKVYLSKLVYHYCAKNGETLTGTLDGNYKISIADDATVTLSDVTINGKNDFFLDWAGITCEGDATLVLVGTNNVTGFYEWYPGIFVESGKTLTINGDGTLNASCNSEAVYTGAAGIGGGYVDDCGNIVIENGTINAFGGLWSAGIGGGSDLTCGDITINGGTVTATGGIGGAGIGAGFGFFDEASCGNITISNGTVTATGGKFAAGIGSGCAFRNSEPVSSCGDIIISGGTVVAIGGDGGYSSELDLEDFPYSDLTIVGGTGIGTGSSGTNNVHIGNKIKDFKAQSTCGDITIESGVTSVTATKGSGAVNSIGLNNITYNSGTCSSVTIGDTEYWGKTGSDPETYDYKNDGETYLTKSSLEYPDPEP